MKRKSDDNSSITREDSDEDDEISSISSTNSSSSSDQSTLSSDILGMYQHFYNSFHRTSRKLQIESNDRLLIDLLFKNRNILYYASSGINKLGKKANNKRMKMNQK